MQQQPTDPDHDSELEPVGPPARPVFQLARRVWSPAPVAKPEIVSDLQHLSWPERSAEVIRFSVRRTEYWLSSGGWLREWIRLNLWLSVVLLVAALLVVPPVTALLEGVRDWTGLLSATIGNINAAVASLPPIVLALATGFLLVKLVQRRRAQQRPDRRHYNPYE